MAKFITNTAEDDRFWTLQKMDFERTRVLASLIEECEYHNVKISKIGFFQNGFIVTFANYQGDAILHDGSYGSNNYKWETMGFPWDSEDVSVHTTEQLVNMIHALDIGEDWEQYDTESWR